MALANKNGENGSEITAQKTNSHKIQTYSQIVALINSSDKIVDINSVKDHNSNQKVKVSQLFERPYMKNDYTHGSKSGSANTATAT